MKSGLLLAFLLLPVAIEAQADTQWVLDQSTLSYHMSHPMHQVDGVSHAAKGKGACDAGQCSFLIAAPVKSFDSGDTNRDLHMLESTRGAQFPMVVVRTSFPETATAASTIEADLEIELAGQTAHYPHVVFQRVSVTWERWVEVWEQDYERGRVIKPLLSVRLLPPPEREELPTSR